MKTFFAVLLLTVGLSMSAMAQCGTYTLLSGCVGACGTSYSASYTVTASDVGPSGVGVFCLGATSNSLCPTDNAYATLTRNGVSSQSGNLNLGDVLAMKARVNDVFTITVTDVFVSPSVDCFWQGETQFSFMR